MVLWRSSLIVCSIYFFYLFHLFLYSIEVSLFDFFLFQSYFRWSVVSAYSRYCQHRAHVNDVTPDTLLPSVTPLRIVVMLKLTHAFSLNRKVTHIRTAFLHLKATEVLSCWVVRVTAQMNKLNTETKEHSYGWWCSVERYTQLVMVLQSEQLFPVQRQTGWAHHSRCYFTKFRTE